MDAPSWPWPLVNKLLELNQFYENGRLIGTARWGSEEVVMMTEELELLF